jgi:electron transfer flavoprotein alpha subunit
MRIAVCIKQVPVVSALQFDPQTRTLKREGVPSEVSSFDVRALLKAVEIKNLQGGEVVVFTMGPPQARQALFECLALGADRAVHLCDRAFAGSDTLATARALALALARDPFDIILCGRNSVDAETGQVGPEVAEFLNLPQMTGVRTLSIDPQIRRVTAERETDDGFETVEAPLPLLVTAAEDLAPERFPSKAEREAAKTKPITELGAEDLVADISQLGASGSPTEVAGLQYVETTRLQRGLEAESVDDAARTLARLLVEEHGLFGSWKLREQPAIAQMAAPPVGSEAKDIWVVSELLGRTLRPVTFELLGKAVSLADASRGQVSAVLFGHDVAAHVEALARYGASRILVADDQRLAPFQTEAHASLLTTAIRRYRPAVVLIPATAMGRDFAPRVAARCQLGLTGDCIDIGLDANGRLLQYKPAFGGTVVAPIVSRTTPEMATVRPGMLAIPQPDPTRVAAIESVPLDGIPEPRVRVVASRPGAQTAADLDEAEIVIGIGKGIGQKEQIESLQPLIDLLQASICSTRDVTDAGWLPKQYQVGLTGRAIAPKLYIAIGIRGAFEHTVGVRRAGLIVAINKSPRAPIFKTADYGIVGDYRDVVPALIRHLSAARPAR